MATKCGSNKCANMVPLLAILANIVLIIFIIVLFSNTYGPKQVLVLILLTPPILSILAIRKGGDKEERGLKKRIRKAHLRKELKEISEFDESK